MRGRFPVVRTTLAAGAVAAFLGTGPCAAAAPVDTAVPQAEDIRDIRGPKLIMAEWVLPAALAAGLLLVGGGYALWRRRRRLDARVLLPYEIALQRLEAIRALMQPAKAPEFTTAVSGVVRGYIEQRFKVTATRRTTEEFLRDLFESSNVSLALVKFAAMSLTLPDMEILHQSARAFVLATAEPEQVIAATSPQSRQSSNNEVGA
jgi:Domain of unknown function (DUF4381)